MPPFLNLGATSFLTLENLEKEQEQPSLIRIGESQVEQRLAEHTV